MGMGISKGNLCTNEIKLKKQKINLALGSSINIAAKLESYTKEFFIDVIVNKNVVEGIDYQYNFLKLPNRKIGNIKEEYQLYWLAPSNIKNKGVKNE